MGFNNGTVLFAIILSFGLFFNVGCDNSTTGDSGLQSPGIIAPSNNSVDNANAVILEWQTTTGADAYIVSVARDNEFSDNVVPNVATQNTTFVLKDLDVGVRYYWRVRATNADDESGWSPTWVFTSASIATIPAIPMLTYPEREADAMPTSIPITWEPTMGALYYELHISMEPGMDRRVADLQVREAKYNVRGLVEGYTYYWRVRSVNALGASGWSEKRRFVCSL